MSLNFLADTFQEQGFSSRMCTDAHGFENIGSMFFGVITTHHRNTELMIDHIQQRSVALFSLRIMAHLSGALANCLALSRSRSPAFFFAAKKKQKTLRLWKFGYIFSLASGRILTRCAQTENASFRKRNENASRQISRAEKRLQEKSFQIEGGNLPTQIDSEPEHSNKQTHQVFNKIRGNLWLKKVSVRDC